MFLFNIISNIFASVFTSVFKSVSRNVFIIYDKFNKYNNSLEKRMKFIIEKNNGKKCHYYKPCIVSLKSKSLLTYINNIKNKHKYKSIIEDKIDLLNIINKVLTNVSKELYLKFDPTMIYTFHNEINLVFFYNENGEFIYDSNINKILTSIVSYASICIKKELEKNDIILDFILDGHFIEFDKDYESLNFLIWRQFECKRNTITLLYRCLHDKDNINNISLDDMKYSLPVISPELFIGNILKKRVFKNLINNPLKTESDKTILKVRKNIDIEYFYFHKDFTNNFTKYIKEKTL
jgi:hypothetical protein